MLALKKRLSSAVTLKFQNFKVSLSTKSQGLFDVLLTKTETVIGAVVILACIAVLLLIFLMLIEG